MITRADTLHTRAEAVAAFSQRGSARVFACSLVALLAARVALALAGQGFGWLDGVVLVVGLVLIGPVEWLLHRAVLHAPDDSWATRRLGLGLGHRQHHLDPPELTWLLLPGREAAIAVVGFGVVMAGWTVPLAVLGSGEPLALFLTGWVFATGALLHYEWVHLLVHTRYRPQSRFYARLARHHRLHHYRNEHFWLGVTSNSGDRLLGTLPVSKQAVELSETARTLR